MQVSNSKKRLKNKIKKIFMIGVPSAVIVLLMSHVVWKFSGSNQWELIRDENGIKVYTLKAPGSTLLKVKSIGRIRSGLSNIVQYMQDPAGCDDIGCYESRKIEEVDSQLQYYTFRADFPFPFKPREYVVKALFYQNPLNKAVFYEVSATPDKMPPNECCFRITDMHNTWQFTPFENGEVEIQLIMDMDLGGGVPYLLINSLLPELAYGILTILEEFVNREKYQNAKFDFIDELKI